MDFQNNENLIFSYTEYRKFCNLPVPVQWEDMKGYIKDDMIIQKLRGLYGVPRMFLKLDNSILIIFLKNLVSHCRITNISSIALS